MTTLGGRVGQSHLSLTEPGARIPRLRALTRSGGDGAHTQSALTAVRERAAWEQRIAVRVGLTDTVLVLAVAASAFLLDVLGSASGALVGYDSFVAGAGAAIWLALLATVGRRDPRSQGAGEYARVVNATLLAFGILAIAVVLLPGRDPQLYLQFALPLGLLAVVLGRAFWRTRLRRLRAEGTAVSRVLIVGRQYDAERAEQRLERDPGLRFRPVGVMDTRVRFPDDVTEIVRAARENHADTVLLTEYPRGGGDLLRDLSWALEGTSTELIVSNRFVDVGPARMRYDIVDGESLARVSLPDHSRRNLVKRGFDVVVTAAIIVFVSPILLGLSAAVKLSSPGPVFYRQERIGLNGRPFAMIKFRSMREGADGELAALLAEQGTSDTPLFKIKNDPRITPIGRFIRKYSLDELPQLFNVLNGTMSLVGPRPQIPDEVALYTGGASRRLLSPPGITGLWQVSGRSTLTWEEAIRLDLFYVENWSLPRDLAILGRTAKAVLAPGETAH